jgi:hypothetical protein
MLLAGPGTLFTNRCLENIEEERASKKSDSKKVSKTDD